MADDEQGKTFDINFLWAGDCSAQRLGISLGGLGRPIDSASGVERKLVSSDQVFPHLPHKNYTRA